MHFRGLEQRGAIWGLERCRCCSFSAAAFFLLFLSLATSAPTVLQGKGASSPPYLPHFKYSFLKCRVTRGDIERTWAGGSEGASWTRLRARAVHMLITQITFLLAFSGTQPNMTLHDLICHTTVKMPSNMCHSGSNFLERSGHLCSL